MPCAMRSSGNNMDLKIGIYKHYKGHTVKVLGVAKHSETLEDLVVYDHMGTNELSDLWVRPLGMFLENVEFEGKTVPRFEYIGE
ncbi:MAG: hypothetical protein JWM20_264 [Patescibacteria group bacterium]|nr:hypothetical protein [Patescibacteria group bacterium]